MVAWHSRKTRGKSQLCCLGWEPQETKFKKPGTWVPRAGQANHQKWFFLLLFWGDWRGRDLMISWFWLDSTFAGWPWDFGSVHLFVSFVIVIVVVWWWWVVVVSWSWFSWLFGCSGLTFLLCLVTQLRFRGGPGSMLTLELPEVDAPCVSWGLCFRGITRKVMVGIHPHNAVDIGIIPPWFGSTEPEHGHVSVVIFRHKNYYLWDTSLMDKLT